MRHVKQNWLKGSALILTSHIAWSAWLILQAVVSKVNPAPLSLTTMICFFASLQSSLLALFFTRDPNSWRLQWNLQLITIIYCVRCCDLGISYYLQACCISRKGPVFAAMFSPLQVTTVEMFSAIAFAERLDFGRFCVQLDWSTSHYCGTLLCAVGKEERRSCC
ncbi:WAT1-related protein [Pyrus ussuriensis x Pyrus communis]|uniref:WAT1-related protein n=1 Tax=Pyrus ussuriensis x Pyrus communis TaxID=2448454 RepID=A0A5N5I3F6_9ROSA|nr:WAT1-related protein [Pyrus ussuriensis x Pyrus communis]